MKPLKEQISITVDSDILEKARKLAEQDDRSLSQFINIALKEYVKKIEDNRGKLYKTDAAGNTELFLHRDKSVFFHHITDYYVFYILIDPVEQLYWEVYRCDLDGNNNTSLSKFMPLLVSS